ncbi:MAG: type I DNA topoisomerase [Syntrophales bacterium]|jgi:DNA topoisomerase-1|nr:type I DNA topoisomerase [Syntrophales bacterium]MDY0045011.1 type I DNA topoisomerase [Syntrophales bacterium]
MSSSLIVVESPTKIKTIKKYLGQDFDVKATVGHVKDLPKSKLGIDIENDFSPTYQVITDRKKTISELKKAAKAADEIFLAPDPDREGEAIAWHIAEEIDRKDKKIYRVLFNDLTRNTVIGALKNPLPLDENKYEAQQTRRILDRLVGYQISPILWEKVKRGLSAGRVQSVAVRIICEREREIAAFVPVEYWNITVRLEGDTPPAVEAKLFKIDGKKKTVASEEEAKNIVAFIEKSDFIVESVEEKEIKRHPSPPFTTSKLQQEASRRFRFSAKKTMRLAQKLYEGIELGSEGSIGLITYMRTDSVRVAKEAVDDARAFINTVYGSDFLPPKARAFKASGKSQDAHEAIRPASISYPPKEIESFLSKDEFRLYQLIWNRFIASQMNPAVFDRKTIDIAAGPYLFRAQGSVMKYPGFTILYMDTYEEPSDTNEVGTPLPTIKVKDALTLLSYDSQQNFTQPPPRFTEASLVRELEEKGIGRPSTYASILSTIQDRDYVTLKERRFYPTDLGTVVTDLLIENFPNILDVKFTASMEDQLDRIEEGSVTRKNTLKDFYTSFESELSRAKESMRNLKREEIATDILCEKCGSTMVIKWGKNGRFLACSNYPDCKNTKNFTHDENGNVQHVEAQMTDISCAKCGKTMIVKEGRYGQFLACSGYPECKYTLNAGVDENGKIVAQPAPATEEVCEVCGKPMAMKRGRFGNFLGCTGYPECKNIKKLNKEGKAAQQDPVLTDEVCDKCGKPMAIRRGRYGPFLACTGYPECKTIKKMPKDKKGR